LSLKLARICERNCVHLFYDELTDRFLVPEGDGCRTEVDHFQRQRPFPTGMNRRRSEVDEQADTSARTLALDACRQRRLLRKEGQRDRFERLGEDELVRVENEPAASCEIDLFATLCEEGSQPALSKVESERAWSRN